MSRRRKYEPLSVESLARLARAVEESHRSLMPVFLWCLCRSDSAKRACREVEPSNFQIALLRSHPVGDHLVDSVDRAAWRWLRERRERKETKG